MSDVCPECGDEYLEMSTVDARPGGALFENYIHSYQENNLFGNHVRSSCIHIIEYGEEHENAE